MLVHIQTNDPNLVNPDSKLCLMILPSPNRYASFTYKLCDINFLSPDSKLLSGDLLGVLYTRNNIRMVIK